MREESNFEYYYTKFYSNENYASSRRQITPVFKTPKVVSKNSSETLSRRSGISLKKLCISKVTTYNKVDKCVVFGHVSSTYFLLENLFLLPFSSLLLPEMLYPGRCYWRWQQLAWSGAGTSSWPSWWRTGPCPPSHSGTRMVSTSCRRTWPGRTCRWQRPGTGG